MVEVEKIYIDLEQLKEFVEEDHCLNAGGKFEWVDSVLVKCLRDGTWLLIDQVNLCSPAVLDRLNGLLEPNGVLSIGERGVDSDGNVVTVKPHKNFRLFLTMDPKHGEISRAMRNRGVEIYMLSHGENQDCGKLDYRSLLYNCGLTKRNHQEALMTVHRRISEDPSNVDNVSVISLLHCAFLVVQQLSRGFAVTQAFLSSCRDVYLRARSIFSRESRSRLVGIVEQTIREYQVDQADDYVLDLDAATYSVHNLQDNSQLTIVRQQGLLLHWCINGYLWEANSQSDRVSLKTDFINEFFGSAESQRQFLSVDVLKILPHVLLSFYEHSALGDVQTRRMWAANVFKQHCNLEFLNAKSQALAEEILFFNFDDYYNEKLPWDRKQYDKANNLALLLYYITLVIDNQIEQDWKVSKSEKFISIAQFSEGLRKGTMTIKLKDQPLITNYVTFLLEIKKYIYTVLRKNKKPMDDTTYVLLRKNFKWFSRFCELNKMTLINKAEGSKRMLKNLDEVVLLLKVHYKWLKKCLNHLDENYEDLISDKEHKEDQNTLKKIMAEIDNSLKSVYDPFRKLCKVYKKHIKLPLPCSSQLALQVCSSIQCLTDSFSPATNKYIASSLMNERKLVTFQSEDARRMRFKLISLWRDIYTNETFDDEIFKTLEEIGNFCKTHLDTRVAPEESEDVYCVSPKEIAKITTKIQLWPLHEYMFTLFVGMYQGKVCEKLVNKTSKIILPSTNFLQYHSAIPNIPIELFAILNAIDTSENNVEEKSHLIFALLIWYFKFSEDSYAIKNVKQISNWKYISSESSAKLASIPDIFDQENLPNGPVLVNLMSELLLNKLPQSKGEKFASITGATLGSYAARLEQLKTLNDILWKNSVALNSTEFDNSANDLHTLRYLSQNFLQVCDKVEADEHLKKSLEGDRSKSTESTIACEYTKPLDDLRRLSETLTADVSNFDRGKHWAVLGYLQAFVCGNMGYIDPVHKVALKLRYIDEDISDSQSTIYVATLNSRILGLVDDYNLQPRIKEIKEDLEHLMTERDTLKDLKAVRPPNTEFIALSKEFTNFRQTIGSYAIVSKHMQKLVETAVQLDNEVNVSYTEAAKLAKREAEIWIESIRRYMEQIEARFLSGYPDIVYPILAGLAQMRHGIRILLDETSKRIASTEANVGTEELNSFIQNLVRFPTVGPRQENLLKLVNLCTSKNSRQLLNYNISSEKRFVVLQEQFRLTLSGLCEFYNYIALKGHLTRELWSELNGLLQQIVLIWQQQQKEVEQREAEKDSLYKNRTQIQGGSLTEEEEIAEELRNLFPTQRDEDFADVDSNFAPSLERKVTAHRKEESFGALITEEDIKEVQALHSSIVKSFTTSEWLSRPSTEPRPDFVQPLLQRYSTFGLLLDKVSPALDRQLTGQLHTSLNVLTHLTSRLARGEQLVAEARPYDYYRDSNVEAVRQCAPLLASIAARVAELLVEWPDHPTLVSMRIILRRIDSFSTTSALARFLTGLELLLVKMHEWEANAHSGVSLTELILALTQQIIAWRKLELDCWKGCLTAAHARLRSHASKWWFFLYSLFESYVTGGASAGEEISTEEPITAKKLIESLETFMSESSIVEFEARLDLILTFHCHAYYLNLSAQRDELLAISWNIYYYYRQFLSDVNARINTIKAPIEKKLKDFVKIARWNDISYWAVKETIEKTHRTLHKYIKEFETGLKGPVTPHLNVKPSYKSEAGIWDRPNNDEECSIDPNDYLVPASEIQAIVAPTAESDLIARADGHYAMRAKKLCKEAILASMYPGLRVGLEEFVDDFTSHSARLRALEVDRTQPQPKQKSQAKHILQQKRKALSDYFKTLMDLGLSHRVGILAWKNKLDEVLDFTIPPLEVEAALKSVGNGKVEKKTLKQWNGCERYYYGSLIKLNALNRTFLTNKTDLGAQNMEWCKGFSTHLILMANRQKKTLASSMKYVVALRSLITNLSRINVDDFTVAKQKELSLSAKSLKELLITVQACLEQLLVYLQACPVDEQVENVEMAYTLGNDNLPIINCKKGDAVWEKANDCIKGCLDTVIDISKKFDVTFSEFHIINEENCEYDVQASIITSKHYDYLRKSFSSLQSINDKVNEFAAMFRCTEENRHPLLENIAFIEKIITEKLNEFNKINTAPNQQSEEISTENIAKYEQDLEKLINTILVVIQNKYKQNLSVEHEHDNVGEHENQGDNEDDYERNKLREKLVESIETDIKTLKFKEIYENLNLLLQIVFNADNTTVISYCRLLKKCLPLLQQYLLLSQFYLNEQVASFRITCKILHMQLNVFLDLATNGFCVPKDLDVEEGEEGEEKSGQKGGMGLGDGEGQKDVSEQIETEDQLDEARPADQEKEKPEDKDCQEEDKGIEMSEDFEGKLQDVEQKDENEGDKDNEDDEDVDKQMGETTDGADKLDEQIWGDDDEPEESEETNKNEDEIGDGEKTGEKEFGAKDDRTTEESENKDDDNMESEKEQQKEINEMEEPEYDEDQVNPYHGNLQPEPEPEPLDLPEDNAIDDDGDMKDDEPDNEENPFDIDKMKEAMPPPETQESETAEKEEEEKKDEGQADDSSDEETEDKNGKSADKPEQEEGNEEETDKQAMETSQETPEEEKKPEEAESTEDKVMPSTDQPSNEMDTAEEPDQREGGSRDQVANATENEQETKEESNAENWQEEKKDKGTGQSQAEQHDAGHSGSSMERSNPVPNRDIEAKQNEKRKNPGKSDESHTLAEKIEPDKKKLKTMIHSQEKLPEDDNKEAGAEQDEEGDPDICQHVKEKDKFDHYAIDAATEEQSKEQASNMEQEQDSKDKEESMDVDMHEDEDIEIIEEEAASKQDPEKVSSEDKTKEKKESKEKGRAEDGQLETVVDVEGDISETSKVTRGTETAFFTNLTEVENDMLSSKYIETKRLEVEKMLSQWSHIPTTEEAMAAWNALSSVTDAPARDLSEKLRLVLEPTQASRLKGDYRTGRRINMRKIIPYIASQFRKDKIWLRRTKPSKRNYQIVLAIDDSSSMADNHSKELAFESLSLIAKAMTYLEAGQLSVLSFGEQTNILHPLGETFNERSGSRLMQELRFEQSKTMVGQLVDFTVDMFQNQNNSMDNAKLLVVLSDGRGIFSEGTEKVNKAVRRARLADIFLVFIIVDNPSNKDSILDIRMPIFQDGKLTGIIPYMDNFPFPFYMILRDINALPGVLSDALRQWFEVVGKIDT